ncbi:MAG TPA: PQQ-binding-like beta-propeller repeat protein [Pirellulales bacterium]|jgi:outer membrane protein assembly factor BamB|nr:PQQ-binding-like beta-propeller repeat protein [Pirellulales bacterium]
MSRTIWRFRKFIFPIGAVAAIVAMTIAGARGAQKDVDKASDPAATSNSATPANATATKEAAKPESPAKGAASNDEKLPIDPVASQIKSGDWNQWGGSSIRDNTPTGKNIPTDWNVGSFDDQTGAWKKEGAKNIRWAARLGSQSYGNPIVANGKVFIGTNNGSGYLKRYPPAVDLGVLLCFNQDDGKFLWQDSSEKLPTGRVNDWPLQGICSTPLAEGRRLWYVTSRGEVKCLDVDKRKAGTTDEPAVIWTLDMMKTLGVSQHNMAACSVTDAGDILFVNTGNGVDEAHIKLPSPFAPSFIAVDKNTGKVLWTDNTPGKNVLHGQWSSPSWAVLGGVPQVIFGAGDGYVYSFLGTAENVDGHPKLLWKFDCNPKESKYVLGGQSTRNHIIGTPVIYDGLVYVGVGEDPEHGEGNGHFWCIDPTKRGDVSPELAYNVKDLEHPILHVNRNQAVRTELGEVARPNANSAAVWHYAGFDANGDGKLDFTETMHRTIGTATIKNNLLFIADFSGVLHCLDAKTGKPHWAYDMLAACWGSACIVEDKVYIGNEDGSVFIFKLSPKMELLSKDSDGKPGGISMGSAVYSTPIVADNVLYISNKNYLFAIQAPPQVAQQ